MDCRNRQADLALYAGGDTDRETTALLEEHLEDCPACRKELEALKGTIRVVSGFGPAVPGSEEFLSGVRASRERNAKTRRIRYSLIASIAAILLIAMLVNPLTWNILFTPAKELVAEIKPVEVESVGYSKAVVSIMPTENKSMTVVWIVSDEVVSKGN